MRERTVAPGRTRCNNRGTAKHGSRVATPHPADGEFARQGFGAGLSRWRLKFVVYPCPELEDQAGVLVKEQKLPVDRITADGLYALGVAGIIARHPE
jgi:hypothetical protein